jgi:hypothetical protein
VNDLYFILSSVTEMRCVVYVFNVSESAYYVLDAIYKCSVSCNAQSVLCASFNKVAIELNGMGRCICACLRTYRNVGNYCPPTNALYGVQFITNSLFRPRGAILGEVQNKGVYVQHVMRWAYIPWFYNTPSLASRCRKMQKFDTISCGFAVQVFVLLIEVIFDVCIIQIHAG